MAMTFVSCEKEKESNYEKNITGTWQYSRTWDEEDGWQDAEDVVTYKFDAKGNLTIKYVDYGASYEYEYFITGSVIRIVYPDGDFEAYTIESMSSGKMVWEETDGYSGKIEFKRK